MTRPNILFLFTDQQRADTVAALGNPIIRTPHLDRLCREGTAFTRAYTPSPVCISARYALATGLPPHVTGITDNCDAPAKHPSFMQRLAGLGYQTHGVGKMHFAPMKEMWGFQSRDFSEEGGGQDDYRAFLDANGYSHVRDPHGVRSEYYYIPQPSQLPARLHNTAWVADRSVAFLERRDRSRPFFLWSSFIKPHPPFENPAPWNKLYRCSQMPAPHIPPGSDDLLTYWNRVQNRYKYHDAGRDELLDRTRIAAYYGCISFIDYHVGRILAALGPDADNTLIVYSSDHGELLGDYGSVGKRCMLDAACRIPLLARWPGKMPGGKTVTNPASLIDVFPTVLQAAGATDCRAHEDGESLLDLAAGKATRTVVTSQFQSRGYALHMAASRDAKYIYSAPDQREWHLDARDVPNALVPALREELRRRHGEWPGYKKRSIPADKDAGLLYQDPPGTQESVDALGPDYARKVTLPVTEATQLLRTEE